MIFINVVTSYRKDRMNSYMYSDTLSAQIQPNAANDRTSQCSWIMTPQHTAKATI